MDDVWMRGIEFQFDFEFLCFLGLARILGDRRG